MASVGGSAPQPGEGRVDFGQQGGGGDESREELTAQGAPGAASSDHAPGTEQESEPASDGAVPAVDESGSEGA